MNRYFKTEGNILFKDDSTLTWGPFYFHSFDKAKVKMNEIMQWIIDWVNEKDSSLNIYPENISKTKDETQIIFDIKTRKYDDEELENCGVLINVEDIFFEDEL